MRGAFALLLLGALGIAAHGQPPASSTSAETAEAGAAETGARQLYEVRRYVVGEEVDWIALDRYLSDVLFPALRRAGAGPIGLFAPAEGAESQDRFVIITYERAEQIPAVRDQLREDQQFIEATSTIEAGVPARPMYDRIQSELLVAMEVMPTAKPAEGANAAASRVYELRTYESGSEKLGDRKVEMFNRGEVPIFLDSGIEPVFLGQAVLGPHTPSLTYLSVYPDDAARQQAWKTFIAHPDWKKLSGEAYYAGTVSKIYKFVLRSLPNSQL
ncbi:NIPSNAP family protein [Candidatus Laterigemmans baculatus]|uniref:NIPSNAP family protein n=1 Tax=Candidatus Laterigemmans baculatus TaxID=2770505 RepID=UPI0013DACB94|nr:NIPSNAP family protein [Candidatus Laterigemmans baculatus]